MQRYIRYWLVFLTGFASVGLGQEHIILRSKAYGLFSMFHHVLYFLDKYEKNQIDGLDIDFAQSGLYYKKELGPNWWEYYFEPIHLQSNLENYERTIVKEDAYYLDINIVDFEYNTTLSRMNFLLKKYIRVKDEILAKVNEFKKNNFDGNFVIGIHYRGTDKIQEAKRVDFNDILEEVSQIISRLPWHRKYKIFVATDEFYFLYYMVYKFGDKVCYLPCHRSISGTPVHYDKTSDPYEKGEEAVLDCLLLANSHVLIRTDSNLSLCSKYFNPYLRTIEMNRRYEGDKINFFPNLLGDSTVTTSSQRDGPEQTVNTNKNENEEEQTLWINLQEPTSTYLDSP